jgi:Lrp/AsnC family leucine-responsive transcriptional regulator
MKLDRLDRKVLNELQRDGRISNVDLAARVNLSESACLRRVRALEQAGLIERYVALLDQKQVGLSGTVFVHIVLRREEQSELAAFEAAIQNIPEVMECYLMTGESDYLLRVVVPDIAAYQAFLLEHLTRIEGTASIKSSFALKQVKYKTALPLDHLEAS